MYYLFLNNHLGPVYNIKISFKKEDIYPQFEGDFTDSGDEYAMASFSAPILIRLNIESATKYF